MEKDAEIAETLLLVQFLRNRNIALRVALEKSEVLNRDLVTALEQSEVNNAAAMAAPEKEEDENGIGSD